MYTVLCPVHFTQNTLPCLVNTIHSAGDLPDSLLQNPAFFHSLIRAATEGLDMSILLWHDGQGVRQGELCTVYIVHCTLYTLYSVQCTVNSEHRRACREGLLGPTSGPRGLGALPLTDSCSLH